MTPCAHHIHALRLLASLCAAPLLAGCPGTTGDEGGEQSASSAGSESGTADGTASGGATTGPGTTAGTMTSDGSTGPAGDCTEEECGPAPGAPNFLCQDGVTWGGPGPCVRGPDGACGWTFVECPPCCYAAEQPADCVEGSSCCADGTWACNDDGGNPTCETASVCACCQLGTEPGCIEGASCCGGGEWQCNDDGGNPTCVELGVVCDLPPLPTCCEPSEAPACPQAPFCCADGTWECSNPGMPPPCESGEPCGGGECQLQGETCASGETCCEGLECCVGVPIPRGQEFCSNNCPISDRNRKRDFEAVDAEAILAKVAALPITTWSYTFEDPAIRHIGPMAQDFAAAFEVGATDTMIFQLDADGVALASIQALHGEVEGLRAENESLHRTLAELQARLDRLERRAR
jgi:predicted nucleic acid-binding Zn ribbon protein